MHSHFAFINLGFRRADKIITDTRYGFSYRIVQTHESHDQIPQTGTVIYININNETIDESWFNWGRYTGAGTNNYFREFTLLCLFKCKTMFNNKKKTNEFRVLFEYLNLFSVLIFG